MTISLPTIVHHWGSLQLSTMLCWWRLEFTITTRTILIWQILQRLLVIQISSRQCSPNSRVVLTPFFLSLKLLIIWYLFLFIHTYMFRTHTHARWWNQFHKLQNWFSCVLSLMESVPLYPNWFHYYIADHEMCSMTTFSLLLCYNNHITWLPIKLTSNVLKPNTTLSTSTHKKSTKQSFPPFTLLWNNYYHSQICSTHARTTWSR